MFWGVGESRWSLVVSMQLLISFCGSPARCHRRITLGALEVSPTRMIKHHQQCYEILQRWVELWPSLKSPGLIKFYWNCFSSHLFLDAQMCAAMFSCMKNNIVLGMHKIKIFIFPAQQKDVSLKRYFWHLFFLEVRALQQKMKYRHYYYSYFAVSFSCNHNVMCLRAVL